MARAIDVANFFIDMADACPDEAMTNLRVNKLVYYAQAWSLVFLGRPLFDEIIEAWEHGPVIPSVYSAFKQYGRDNIKQLYGNYSDDFFTQEEMDLLMDVSVEYMDCSASKLWTMTHENGEPWSCVYDPSVRNIPIPNNLIKKHFSSKKPIYRFEPSKLTISSDGWHDEDGCLVLPKEYDCEEDAIYDTM